MQHALTEHQSSNDVLRRLTGDICAATASATLVSPAVTTIDRAIVEQASLNQSLLRGLRNHTLAALKYPGRFVFSAPFRIIWTLYTATYTVANGTDTVGHALKVPATGMMTFVTTTLVNVPTAVWKDVRFAQIYGTSKAKVCEAAQKPLAQSRNLMRGSTAIFLLRDCVTIFGCFTLAPRLADAIPESNSLASHPNARTIVTQLTVPMLTQLVATPLHLLGLDLYMRQYSMPLADRLVQSQRYLASTTIVRCIRILPAFGFGGLANLELRSFFHRMFGVS
ncbi:hypothetical protein BJX68DRAFT_278721 [Aspergillus pseudodeflectus]|uniref:Mitochondrial carrier domain-containing protein n=1 Tax=Aspergillus pseudodeflectus TaxID=176178 RepID=A0ABR4JMF3_9EURO